jgi:hypothetical protein
MSGNRMRSFAAATSRRKLHLIVANTTTLLIILIPGAFDIHLQRVELVLAFLCCLRVLVRYLRRGS